MVFPDACSGTHSVPPRNHHTEDISGQMVFPDACSGTHSVPPRNHHTEDISGQMVFPDACSGTLRVPEPVTCPAVAHRASPSPKGLQKRRGAFRPPSRKC